MLKEDDSATWFDVMMGVIEVIVGAVIFALAFAAIMAVSIWFAMEAVELIWMLINML